ncbi:bifunctional 5,10-methylene-tetrahydrofolate dehydrogenase/5,10-methylene-tetrahydrofolate cyclohydrolase [candidate division KSB1 bacterium]|nr:bifunctional 5,10-methylene-tetrahydrofolate dehydrogenase/5,10-methylene-tetrahydrofolate cyclohydrolase [candidate division KSB1 bacterium]
MVQIIDGKKIAQEIKSELIQELVKFKTIGLQPGLTVILVGDNPASVSYVRMKRKTCDELRIFSSTLALPASVTQTELLAVIGQLNQDITIHGILVQLPLPKHIDETQILRAILPEKDVDGFHPLNKGKLLTGEDTFVPCTPAGIQELLLRSGHPPDGKHVVILGRSQIVGLPLAVMLMQKKTGANATVTLCHTGTSDITRFTRQADIVIAAMGKPECITGAMLRPECVVIDVGTNRVTDPTCEKGYRLTGDVEFQSAAQVARAISPVPGGVGPMTIIMLMKNTLKATRLQIRG